MIFKLLKKSYFFWMILPALATGASGARSPAQVGAIARGAWVAGQAHALNVERIAQSVAKARVIAIGESTHGTSEFQQFRADLTQSLVSRHGFDTIVLEATDAGVVPLNDFVQGKDEDLHAALAGSFYWIWQNDEFVRIFGNLRSLNKQLSGDGQSAGFTVKGMDIFPRGATRTRLKDILTRYDSGLAVELERLENAVSSSKGSENKKIAREAVKQFLAALPKRIDQSNIDADTLESLAGSVRDLHSFYSYISAGIPDQEARDRAMADNVKRLVEAGHRVVVWVHNGHVGNAPGAFGSFLKQRYGSGYVPVGLTTFGGTYSGLEPGTNKVGMFALARPPKGSLESYLAKTPYSAAFLDLRSTRYRNVPQWLRKPLPCRPDIGFFKQPESQALDECTYSPRYDLIVFLKATTGTKPFPIWPNGVPMSN